MSDDTKPPPDSPDHVRVLLENLLGDARFALRHFRRTWGSTAAMVLVLALGTGANTALYAGLQAFLTLPAPGIPRDDRQCGG
jgi:hypothetical protein